MTSPFGEGLSGQFMGAHGGAVFAAALAADMSYVYDGHPPVRMSPADVRILRFLLSEDRIERLRNADIAAAVGCGNTAVKVALRKLLATGAVCQIGGGKGRRLYLNRESAEDLLASL